MPPDGTERRPGAGSGVQNDQTVVKPNLTHGRRREAALRLAPYSDSAVDPFDDLAGLPVDLAPALDYLDGLGLCVCWVTGRQHARTA